VLNADAAKRFIAFLRKHLHILLSNSVSNSYFSNFSIIVFLFIHFFLFLFPDSCRVDTRRCQLWPGFGASELGQGRIRRDRPVTGTGELGQV
jgi:hypothetical protein